ncbi:MAG TPA: glycosyltransferase family A protein [Candidatus Limnocylindrales bacterium]|nr:glycosyltransferase family A protein [Candidatus Limnocylindrales bacterium]
MTILVAVPYYGVPELVGRCVQSILAQTVRDIAVVVIGDGERPPLAIADSRLEVYSIPDNHGPYFAQQVALLASPFDRYAPVGADDWLEPEHLERLVDAGGEAVVTGAVWFHNLAGGVSVHEGNYEVGLFDRDRLLSIGGHNPSERVGQDSLLIHLLRHTGDLRATHHPTYHRVKRPDSLMTSALTGKGTPYRNDVRRRNRIVLAECKRLGTVDAIRDYRERIVPAHVRNEVLEHAARLSERLGRAVAA